MLDANKAVKEILETVGVKVTFYHPQSFNDLPVISYHDLADTTGMCYDNAEQAQVTSMAVDIWGSGGGECARLAIKVDAAMQEDNWRRELSMDMPPEDGVYHKTMRFKKQIFF